MDSKSTKSSKVQTIQQIQANQVLIFQWFHMYQALQQSAPDGTTPLDTEIRAIQGLQTHHQPVSNEGYTNQLREDGQKVTSLQMVRPNWR